MQKQPQFLHPDGTSQAGRIQKALDPAYVSVDERSIKDLLVFAQKYSEELRYFNEQNEQAGDWAGFLQSHDLDQLAAYIDNPDHFQGQGGEQEQALRPHLVLFLTFLELLQHARAQLNDLTRRHLEFYYREALRLTSQAGVPDRVHALVELAGGQEQFLLPAGTLFQAGPDSLGVDRLYRSDEDLLANRAQVESVRSLFAEKQVIGIREAAQTPDLLVELFPARKDVLEEGKLKDRSFMAMLIMALGNPGPGGALAPYPDNRTVNVPLLEELDTLLDFVPSELYMPFSTFRSLMQLKEEQSLASRQWDVVNNTLEKAGKRRNPQFRLDRAEPANFEKNLLAALGRSEFGDFFNGLPEVEDIYDLYRRRDRDDVLEFIDTSLYMSVDDFSAMMKIVEDMNARWRQIYEILRTAGRKKQKKYPEHQLESPMIRTYEADKFSALVQRTLGTIDYSRVRGRQILNFDDCHVEIIKLEDYFHIPAEKFVFIRAINKKPENARPWEQEQAYEILEEAHREKALVDRRNVLKVKKESEGFNAMILFALGDPAAGDDLPDSRDFMELDPEQAIDQAYIQESLFLDTLNFMNIKKTQANQASATQDEWANVYAILERAQRRKRGWQDARAEIQKWDNLYMAADATQVQVRLGTEDQTAVTPRWRTFGEGHSPAEGPRSVAPGKIGFAIASPLLSLAEGTRKITLTIGFHEERFDRETINEALKAPGPFRFLLSSEKEMLAVQNVKTELLDGPFNLPGAGEPYRHALQVTLTLDEQAPPVTAPATGADVRAAWPVLQVMLADIDDDEGTSSGPLKRYRAFQALALEKIHLRVDVDGIRKLTLQNDDSLLDPKKPFEPFGMAPVAGSSFYLAHAELSSKKLDELRLNIDWLAAPDNLNAYYLGYKDYADPQAAPASPIADNTGFKAQLKLRDNRSSFDISQVQLFNAGNDPKTGASQTSRIKLPGSAILQANRNYQRDTDPGSAPQALDWHRYWQLELLAPDFQHTTYPRAAAGGANKVERASDNTLKPKPFIVNPPYTPKVKSLSAGYSASLEIDLKKGDAALDLDRLYHIEPFGYRDLAGYEPRPYPFLPQYENEGELFIGIRNLAAPQSLSLLFQMAEGSADPNVEREPIHWSFLDGNRWHSLEEGRLLSDTTDGLLNAGIVKFDLPAVEPCTLLPTDLYWIRASITRNSKSVGDTIAIKAQAVSATFDDHGNAPDHLAQPLPAGSMTSLAETRPEVKAVHQPYSSFGGKSPEQAGSFYTRVSERLRHKNRALTAWDYEHMVLEAFPGIFKVKCLPVGAAEDPRLADLVQIVVIPDIRGKLPFDPFEPKAPADMLRQIEKYLARHSASFARFKVKNPTYVRLKVRLGIRLRQDTNTGYYRSALNEELQRYLAPWAYDRSAEISFGGKINTSLLVNFVEERSYVDYVAGIKLFTSLDGQHYDLYVAPDEDGLGEVSVFAPDSILVSDQSHQIDLITEEGYEQEYFTGINYMKIELDFQVAAATP